MNTLVDKRITRFTLLDNTSDKVSRIDCPKHYIKNTKSSSMYTKFGMSMTKTEHISIKEAIVILNDMAKCIS